MRPVLAALLLTAACTSGRAFKDSTTLTDYRAERAPQAATPIDDAFRAEPPKLLKRPPIVEATPVVTTLSNGIRIVMLERHDFPEITADFVLDRGLDAGSPRVIELYERATTLASTRFDHRSTQTYLEHVGGKVRADVGADFTLFHVDALTPLFVSALSRAAPLFYAPSLTNEDLDEARAATGATRKRAEEIPAVIGRDTLIEAVFPPNHPYGRTRHGLAGRRELEVSNDAVRAYRDTLLGAEHMGVAVVGDFQVATMQKWLEDALGKVPAKARAPADVVPDVPPKASPKLLIIDRPGAEQSNVSIGWRGPRATDPALVPVEVLAHAAGGELSTRLNLTLRKELGATYGVHMQVTGYRAGGIFEINTALDTPRTIDGLQRLFKELGRFRTEPLGATELAKAKLRSYEPLESGTTAGLAAFLAQGVAHGVPAASTVTHDARIDLVTAESVQNAATQFLAPDGAVVVIVGDASKLSGLGALGLGTPEIVR